MNTMFTALLAICGSEERPLPALAGQAPGDAVQHSADLRSTTFLDGALLVLGDAIPSTSAAHHRREVQAAEPMVSLTAFALGHWGRFIGIARDPGSGRIALYRDPSGMIPCYYARQGNLVAIGTDSRVIADRLNLPVRIDWAGVAHCLLAPDYRGHHTGLEGIKEVLPGEFALIDPQGESHKLLWSPAPHLSVNAAMDFHDASALLQRELEAVTARWIDIYPEPLVAVSGGFDSSTIAALAARHGKINVQHFHTRSLMGDERQYAGAMASYLDLPLPMQLCDAGEVTIHETFSAHRPRPSSRVFTQIFDKYSAARVKIIGASAHFNGGGGDSVFGKLHSAYPLADRYLATGMSRALWTTALDICGATGASLKDVLRQAIRAARGRDMLAPWPLQTDLLTPRAIEIAGMEVHPWFAAAQGAHPGQRQHIRSIVRATATTDYLNICDTVPTIYPLLSQPIVELCLSFPTWFWFCGARDRSLARTALEAYLPRSVLDRTVKGAFDGLLHEIVDRHRQEIIPELENGILVEQGLVDRAAITALRSGSQRTTVTRLLHLHEVQTWCLAWMG